jgi:hypothetical protein
MTETEKEPTQAVTPGADEEEVHDDPHQSNSEMTDPAQAAASEFEAD